MDDPVCLKDVGIVVIGRNEGERLIHCLAALPPGLSSVYVDSGSVDGSPTRVRAMGFEVLELSSDRPFSAARARNEGLARLVELNPGLRFVQMLDGDCQLDENWLSSGARFLDLTMKAAAVVGQCREAHPERSLFNALCDLEWRTPVGEIESCGGNAMMRIDALESAGGYDNSLIAGEEPDLCLRLRAQGWKVFATAEEMVLHDAAMTRFSQWAKRAIRSGFAFAQLVARHGLEANASWRRALISILFWGAALPGIAFAAGWLLSGQSGEALAIGAAGTAVSYALQAHRIARRIDGRRDLVAWYAVSLMIAKPLQLCGVTLFAYRRLSRSSQKVIDYKSPVRVARD